jgi:methylated-DNA-protein-cysteine methyltransferase-like protein
VEVLPLGLSRDPEWEDAGSVVADSRPMADFEQAVIAALMSLRTGEVVTYGEVAEQAGFPGAARAVGTLLRRTTAEVPWWRVVGAGGHIRSPEPSRQAELLAAEGVKVRGRRVVT